MFKFFEQILRIKFKAKNVPMNFLIEIIFREFNEIVGVWL